MSEERQLERETELNDSLTDMRIQQIRSSVPAGMKIGGAHCIDCGIKMLDARRLAGYDNCVGCAEWKEKMDKRFGGDGMNPYETLGLDPEATEAEIKAAYRKAAQKSHPDREDGDAEQFHQVALAYDVLSDPERRAKYDETGDTSEKSKPAMSNAEMQVIQLFDRIIESEYEGDIIRKAKSDTSEARLHGEAERAATNAKIASLEKLIGRVEAKGDNLFQMVLESKLDNARHRLDSIEEALVTADEVDAILDEYSDVNPEEPKPKRDPAMNMGMGGFAGAFGGAFRTPYGNFQGDL